MKILLTGATGFLGKSLGIELARRGHSLVVVSRSRARALEECPFPCEVIEGDLGRAPLPGQVRVDAVVNLQGEPIASSRWTPRKREELARSRVQATRHLVASLEPVTCFISGSAIGYYGDRGEELLPEAAPAGKGFLPELCTAWEDEARKAPAERIVLVRTGLVLGAHGGALAELLPLFRSGLAGPLAGGRQWMSWIHWRDMVEALVFAVENPAVRGALNAVAPRPVTNAEFTRLLARRLCRPAFLPAPGFALRLALGERSCLLTESQRVEPRALLAAGFQFRHAELGTALEEEAHPREDRFLAQQYLPRPPAEVFPFFAAAENLEKLTPPLLRFHVLRQSHPQVVKDARIEYRLRIHGLPVRWETRIDSWDPPRSFSDNQERGPYALWHHTHTFEPLGTGTLMTDSVRFRLPFGYLGWLGGFLLVRRDVREIFAYRRKNLGRYL